MQENSNDALVNKNLFPGLGKFTACPARKNGKAKGGFGGENAAKRSSTKLFYNRKMRERLLSE